MARRGKAGGKPVQTRRCKTEARKRGDIHGRLDLLDQLIDTIKRDVDEYGNDCLTVTLGDYIDRGPNSRGVLETHTARLP